MVIKSENNYLFQYKSSRKQMFPCLMNSGKHRLLGGPPSMAQPSCLSELSALLRLRCYLICLITPSSVCIRTPHTLPFSSFVSSHFSLSRPTSIKHRWPVLRSIISLALLPSISALPSLPLRLIPRPSSRTSVWHSIWLDLGEHDRLESDSSESISTWL